MVKYTKIYLLSCNKYTMVYIFSHWLVEHNSVQYYRGGVFMGEREKQYTGTISYKKLFELMEQRNIKKRDLREKYNISPTIIQMLQLIP